METVPVIGVTMGDFNGIAPEVILKAISNPDKLHKGKFVIIGSGFVINEVKAALKLSLNIREIKDITEIKYSKDNLFIVDLFANQKLPIEYGKLTRNAGEAAAISLEYAIENANKNLIDAVVTGPVSKYALSLAGRNYPGQTEMFAELTHSDDFAMILMASSFRVGLVTTHCAISDVADKLSQDAIYRKIKIIYTSLINDFKIINPEIAVTSLNPHGGEKGLFGNEEIRYITPAIDQANNEGINAFGPFPADTLFAKLDDKQYDAYLVMYHDQGLIPLKMKSFGKGVNFTAGLPFIRVSPDHGTAFNISGKWIANHTSMKEAINIGIELAQKRKIR